MSLILVNPGIPVSTQWAYKNLAMNASANPSVAKPEELPLVFNTKKDVVKFLNNDLEKVTIKEFPVISEIKKLLVDQGAIASQMTGSGPTVFGIYPDKASADKAISKIEGRSDKKWKVYRVENYC